MSLSYTKAVLDYKLATQHEDKIKNSGATLSRVKIYIPSKDLCKRIEAVETEETKGQCSRAIRILKKLSRELEEYQGPEVTEKIVNNRYKLAGNYCIKLEYYFPNEDITIRFPVDPDLIMKTDVNIYEFLENYTEIFSAYSVSKKYIEKIRSRVTILRDEF